MPRRDPITARSRTRRPGVEALESRDLPAVIPLPAIPTGSLIESLPAVQYAESYLFGTNTPLFAANPTNATITQADGSKIPTPQPSVHELHREFLELKAFANYTISGPRFQGQAETIHASGTRGTSNQFLNGRPQLILFPSTDPTQPATGLVTFVASNNLFSGATLILDLTETKVNAQGLPDPNGQYERGPGGLPENFTWTLDATGGTVYTGSNGETPNPAYAAFVNPYYAKGETPPTTTIPQFIPGPVGSGTGAGVLNISYAPAAGSTSASSGQVTITGSGLTDVPGVNNTAAQHFS